MHCEGCCSPSHSRSKGYKSIGNGGEYKPRAVLLLRAKCHFLPLALALFLAVSHCLTHAHRVLEHLPADSFMACSGERELFFLNPSGAICATYCTVEPAAVE